MVRRRPTCTPELIATVAKVLRRGGYRQDAAACAGIDPSTLRAWVKRGLDELRRIDSGGRPRKRDSVYVDLALAVEKAEGRMVADQLNRINTSAQGAPQLGIAPVWQASAWLLERRRPDQYGKRQRLDLDASGGLTIEGDRWLADRLRNHDDEPDG